MAVTLDNIAVLLGRAAPDSESIEGRQWSAWIATAQNLIAWRFGADAVAGMDPALVDYVVAEAVSQHVRAWTPENVSRREVAVDDARTAVQYFRAVGSLTISDDLWAKLTPAGVGAVSTVQLVGESDCDYYSRTVWP